MKRVKYLAGAAGIAPVLGLMTPAVDAAGAVTHAPVDKGKSVSLVHIKSAHSRFRTCANPGTLSKASVSGKFHGVMGGAENASCVDFVGGHMSGGHTELDMRIRYYNASGAKFTGSSYIRGHRNGASTDWSMRSTLIVWEACIALVEASDHNKKKFNTICMPASQLR